MSSLIDPRAAARIKAAFQTCELVARTVHKRRIARTKTKAAATRSTMIYERGTVRLVTAQG
ncbi:MAG TPA: hypothetical protein VHM01_00305 [Alphaproteobacteria bacterium]|nr:hypothetical protein [Alphaproteobacteria bacterium]